MEFADAVELGSFGRAVFCEMLIYKDLRNAKLGSFGHFCFSLDGGAASGTLTRRLGSFGHYSVTPHGEWPLVWELAPGGLARRRPLVDFGAPGIIRAIGENGNSLTDPCGILRELKMESGGADSVSFTA